MRRNYKPSAESVRQARLHPLHRLFSKPNKHLKILYFNSFEVALLFGGNEIIFHNENGRITRNIGNGPFLTTEDFDVLHNLAANLMGIWPECLASASRKRSERKAEAIAARQPDLPI